VNLTAREIMTTTVVTVSPDTSVDDLAKLLADNNISGVPVVDYLGQVVGIVTEADILTSRPGNRTVQSVMTKEVVAVSVDETLQEIAFLLSMRRINRVPVLEEGKLVGIISRADVVRALAHKSAPAPAASAEPSD
jgi:CBS domain-containing protein